MHCNQPLGCPNGKRTKCIGLQLVPMQFMAFPLGCPDGWLQCMYLPL